MLSTPTLLEIRVENATQRRVSDAREYERVDEDRHEDCPEEGV